jgi:hypothetical protein
MTMPAPVMLLPSARYFETQSKNVKKSIFRQDLQDRQDTILVTNPVNPVHPVWKTHPMKNVWEPIN